MNTDSRSQDERTFDSGVEMETQALRRLVKTLAKERNAWRDNAISWEKENKALRQELDEIKQWRSIKTANEIHQTTTAH